MKKQDILVKELLRMKHCSLFYLTYYYLSTCLHHNYDAETRIKNREPKVLENWTCRQWTGYKFRPTMLFL